MDTYGVKTPKGQAHDCSYVTRKDTWTCIVGICKSITTYFVHDKINQYLNRKRDASNKEFLMAQPNKTRLYHILAINMTVQMKQHRNKIYVS